MLLTFPSHSFYLQSNDHIFAPFVCRTAIGIKCVDGIVIAVEKVVYSFYSTMLYRKSYISKSSCLFSPWSPKCLCTARTAALSALTLTRVL